MKSSTRTIIVIAVLNLTTGSFALAQDPPEQKTLTISGSAGIAGVEMIGLPGNVITDQRGYYSVTVPYSWSGTVTAVKEDYRFKPVSIRYTKVVRDLTNQEYIARPEPSNAEDSGQYESFGSSRSMSRSRASGPNLDSTLGTSVSRSRRRSSSGYKPTIHSLGRKVLIVPSGQIKAKELAAITEDMQVMSHILDQRFKETRRIQGVFIDFGDFFGRDNRATEAIYLQGYGVLFSIEVNFSFSPPPKAQGQETEQPAEQVDSAWEKARRQVFSPGGSQATAEAESPEQYNSQMVEELKRDLIATLKHAANIRNLWPDEWVILTVIGGQRMFGMGGGGFGGGMMVGPGATGSRGSTGTGSSSGRMGGMMSGGGFGGGYIGGGMMGGGIYGGMSAYGGTTSSSSTVLTIRAKKSDVDGFAKGELDFEQFQEHVQIFMY